MEIFETKNNEILNDKSITHFKENKTPEIENENQYISHFETGEQIESLEKWVNESGFVIKLNK